MFKRLSLRMKLFALITLAVIVTFGTVSILVSYRSVQTAEQDAFALADEMSAKYSYEIRSELQAARVTSESLMTVFQTLIERDDADRDTLNAILQNSLKQKQYIISFCVAFEPNALDGKDAEFAGQYPLYGSSGRYAPYWSLQDGVIDVEPLDNFDDDVWYAGARDAGTEYITDPFFYEVQGEQVLMSSFVFPVYIDGEFIGIVSSDMGLDSLQEMVSNVNTSGLDEFTEIYSNSGLVVAHPNDESLNKSVFATSAYNMLVSDSSKLQQALDIANAYIETHEASADDEEAAADYENAVAFTQNLADYIDKPEDTNLDLTLLTNSLALEILQLDEKRLVVAQEATAAIANGEPYTVIEDGYYTVYTPIQFSETTNPWSVAVNVPMTKVSEKADALRDYVILISIIGFLFIALVLYLVTRNLTKPILELAESAEQVGQGNFAVDVPQVKSKDEVGVLATAFATMVKQIHELVNKLTNKSEELEEKNAYLAELNLLLAEARDEAEASNKAKSAFLSNMSHEMRTPLNAIVGMTAIGQKATELDKKDDSFTKIEDASEHLLSLINDILDMSKMEANMLKLAPAPFEFRRMCNIALDLVRPQLNKKNQVLAAEVDSDIPEVLIGDDFRLSQVLINLLSNAVKFTPEEGEIGLRAHVKSVKDDVYTLQFEVSDTGIGISAEQQDKLFSMFEQADNSTTRSFGGTGLGLALSKRIVELMDGEIWIESELDKGSSFLFTVKLKKSDDGLEDIALNDSRAPGAHTARTETTYDGALEGASQKTLSDNKNAADATGATASADESATANAVDFSGKKILLAEDIAINQEIVLAMLESTHVEIDCVVNGQEAYDLFAAHPHDYDLILMDIQMPHMDGIEATKLIRTLDTNIPIIALTANVFKEDVETYLENGINAHIGKPLDYELTIELLKRYLS